MAKIRIRCGRVNLDAEILDTPTGRLVMDRLPLSGNANIWGEEIYFPIDLKAEQEKNAAVEVEEGTLAYWPPGKAFCIFFGPTPMSTSSKPKAYSPVNIFGTIISNPEKLREVSPGEHITVEWIEEDVTL